MLPIAENYCFLEIRRFQGPEGPMGHFTSGEVEPGDGQSLPRVPQHDHIRAPCSEFFLYRNSPPTPLSSSGMALWDGSLPYLKDEKCMAHMGFLGKDRC